MFRFVQSSNGQLCFEAHVFETNGRIGMRFAFSEPDRRKLQIREKVKRRRYCHGFMFVDDDSVIGLPEVGRAFWPEAIGLVRQAVTDILVHRAYRETKALYS